MEGQMALIPKTHKAALRTTKYKDAKHKHSDSGKKKWVYLKQKGQWNYARAATATATGFHTVCYYNPKTGLWDLCVDVAD
jgi:hypothetical protein